MVWLYFLLFPTILNSIQCKSILDKNDTALELLNNCKCMKEEHCHNGVVNIRGVGIISMRNNVDDPVDPSNIQCSKSSHVCCKNHPDAVGIRNDLMLVAIGPTGNVSSNNKNEKLTSGDVKEKKSVDICGKPKPSIDVRILSDPNDISSTVDGEFPWVASIYKKDLSDTFRFRCAGSLISDNVILTAAHCIQGARKKPSLFRVLANAKKTLLEIGEDPSVEREVDKIIVHPEYYAGGAHNDIALIFLRGSYNESRKLNSVCLPDTDFDYDRQRCIAVGWGKTREGDVQGKQDLRKVELPLVDREKCENALRKTKLGKDFELHGSFLCAGGSRGKDTCKGDGGGPLSCPDDEGFFIQVGIVSWGVGCGDDNTPGVYTDVYKFKDWIDANIKT